MRKQVFETLIDGYHILDLDLKVLSILQGDERNPPTVRTQLSVIAWNMYESHVMDEIMAEMAEVQGQEIPIDSPLFSDAIYKAVRDPRYVNVIHQRGALKSEFTFTEEGVLVHLYETEELE